MIQPQASIHLFYMAEKDLYLDMGLELKRWLTDYVCQKYKEQATVKYLAEKTHLSENTINNYFYERTPMSLKFLLYFVFAFEMDETDAYAFLYFFGYTKFSLYYKPYKDFRYLIGNYFYMDMYTPKDYVDLIIKESS